MKAVVKLVLSLILVSALIGGFLQCSHFRLGNGSHTAPNCYERAQSATGLIVSPSGGSGSGVVVRRQDKLFIWTAAHVVDDCDTVTFRSYVRHAGSRVGHSEFTARVIARNNPLDVALLWLSAPPEYFQSVKFADELPLRVGQSVYHVGNFHGSNFDDSVSIGVISQIGVRPNVQGWPWSEQLDQTTAFIVYGSSGGGIFRHSDNALVGIIVGGPAPGVADINLFVPVRHIVRWAKGAGLTWAVYGDYAPDESILKLAADVAERQRKLLLLPPPVVKLHDIVCPD